MTENVMTEAWMAKECLACAAGLNTSLDADRLLAEAQVHATLAVAQALRAMVSTSAAGAEKVEKVAEVAEVADPGIRAVVGYRIEATSCDGSSLISLRRPLAVSLRGNTVSSLRGYTVSGEGIPPGSYVGQSVGPSTFVLVDRDFAPLCADRTSAHTFLTILRFAPTGGTQR